MSMNLKASFVSYLLEKYPNLDASSIGPLVSENLLSPFQVPLSSQLITQIRSEIKKYWAFREWGAKNLASRYEALDLRKPENYGVCMSYDFHVNATGNLDLIEINTNASFLALGIELYQFLKLEEVASGFNEKKIIEMFQQENQLNHRQDLNLAIVDEKPKEQKLYVEFLLYQSILRKHGFDCTIADLSEIESLKKASLVYNRYTDFYLQTPEAEEIKKAFNAGGIQLSPHPYEYFLLADKERFIDWTTQSELDTPASLLATYDLGKTDKEKIWNERKNLFFKPKNSFGGRQTYRGSSISRKVFEEVTNSNFIAQKMSPAPEMEFEFKNEKIKLKYDLRCYAYQDHLQMIVARLYQGQTTNLRTEGGGFACILSN